MVHTDGTPTIAHRDVDDEGRSSSENQRIKRILELEDALTEDIALADNMLDYIRNEGLQYHDSDYRDLDRLRKVINNNQ